MRLKPVLERGKGLRDRDRDKGVRVDGVEDGGMAWG